jgi:hypothetical protein
MTTERLQAARAELEQRGVLDVKFYFERGSLSGQPGSVMTAKAADFIECYLKGHGVPEARVESA